MNIISKKSLIAFLLCCTLLLTLVSCAAKNSAPDDGMDPNFNALRFLLTNWSDQYSNDPAAIRQRVAEFEHRKKMDEENSW